MNRKRLTALLAAFVMTMLLLTPVSLADPLEGVEVVSAPLRRAATEMDGMVRVLLKDMGFRTHLDITVTGNYSVNGNSAMSLSSGDKVAVDFNESTGKITMTLDGLSYDMGSEMRLRRHQANGESAVSIAQANRPSNLYPGDLQLLAVKKNDGYQLHPIVHVYLEYYLRGVVPYEMSSSFPIEALKAQAVAARTYTLRQMNARSSYTYDLDDTSSYQVYRGHTTSVTNATKAVNDTQGIVAMNDGKLSGTYYTASNGGQTESVKNAWGSSGYGYLGVKDDPFDVLNTSSNRRRLTIYSDFDHASQNAALAGILTAAAQSQLGSGATIQSIDSVIPHTPKYPVPSRLYTKMDFSVTALVNGATKKATLSFSIFDDLETQLGLSINSGKNELWSVESLEGGFKITVGRWGHGIGMSQRGAQQMARMGYTYDQVLGFYYPGCERVQYTFTHTILPVGSSNNIVNKEPPAEITPGDQNQASVVLPGVNDITPLRYTAAENGKVLIGIPNGAMVTALSKGTTWSLVRYGQINGYLPTAQLNFTGTPGTSTSEKATSISLWGVVSGTNSLNFRTGPGYDYDVQTELPEGTVLCILLTSGNWVKVQHGNQVGYVSPDYLKMHNSYPAQTNADTSAMVSLAGESGTAPLLASPSTEGATLMNVAHGTQVTVVTNDGSWCRVKVAGKEGYLLTSQLDFDANGVTPDVPDVQGVQAIVNSNSSTLNLRASASTAAAILAQIPKGTTITVTERGATWCAVTWGELSGYVMTQYLLFPEDETTPPTETPDDTNPPAQNGDTAWIIRKVEYAALYERANADAAIITQIPSGDELVVLEMGSPYSYVRHGVSTGYVLSANLTYTKPLESIGILYVNTVSDALALRDKASLSGSKVLVYVPKGEKVMLYKDMGDWCHVQYGDYVGYCSADYLSRRKPTEYEEDNTPIYDPSLMTVTGWNAVINADGKSLPMYKWCSTESKQVNTVPDGNTVRLLARGDIWCKITFEGETGYCLTSKLNLLAPAAE